MDSINKNTINALRDGNHKAFEQVFIVYYNKIKTFIFGYLKSEIDAEELTEDIFVKLWINRISIDVNKSFSSYMHTIARNSALNFLKHKHIQESYQANYDQLALTHTPEETLIANETVLLIEMAVEKMPEQRKKIYQLSRNQGLKNEEIAHLLNTTKRNVESQLSLALKDIRKAILSIVTLAP
jgi:RNA polymerase sigma-70 factor (ECF subfamily)